MESISSCRYDDANPLGSQPVSEFPEVHAGDFGGAAQGDLFPLVEVQGHLAAQV
jgi:hypothetical protein